MDWGGGRNLDGREEADVRIEQQWQDDLRTAWQGYVDLLEPLRPTRSTPTGQAAQTWRRGSDCHHRRRRSRVCRSCRSAAIIDC